MKSVLITTKHSAPYIDSWINALEKEFFVEVFYVYRESKEKKWKQYSNSKGHEYSEYSFVKKIAIFKRYDLVILGGWHILTDILLCFALIPFKTKVALFCDYPISETTKTNFIMRLIKRTIMNAANYIFSASESCKEYMHNTYKIKTGKIKIFPYAHSLPSSNIDSINRNRIEQLRIDKSPVNLFIANNFLKRKGFDIVADALLQLNKKYITQLKIRIAGADERTDYYRSLLEIPNCQVDFLGWIETIQYEEEMNNCDIFLHASIFEPFGIPPLDAMQRGKFVIVSDGVKSMSNFTSIENKRVLFYTASDSLMLAKQLKYTIDNKMSLYENYEKTIEDVDKVYSIDNNINVIKNILL